MVIAAVSSRSRASEPGMFAPIRMKPPMPDDSTYARRALGSVVGMCPMTTLAAFSRVVIAATRSDAVADRSSADAARTTTVP